MGLPNLGRIPRCPPPRLCWESDQEVVCHAKWASWTMELGVAGLARQAKCSSRTATSESPSQRLWVIMAVCSGV